MGIQKAIASLVTGIFGLLAAYGFEPDPKVIAAVQTLVGTAAVYIVRNR